MRCAPLRSEILRTFFRRQARRRRGRYDDGVSEIVYLDICCFKCPFEINSARADGARSSPLVVALRVPVDLSCRAASVAAGACASASGIPTSRIARVASPGISSSVAVASIGGHGYRPLHTVTLDRAGKLHLRVIASILRLRGEVDVVTADRSADRERAGSSGITDRTLQIIPILLEVELQSQILRSVRGDRPLSGKVVIGGRRGVGRRPVRKRRQF